MKKHSLTKKEANQIKKKIKELKYSLKKFKLKQDEKEITLVEQLELWDTHLKPYEKAYKKTKKQVKNDKKSLIIAEKLSDNKKKRKDLKYALTISIEKKKEKEVALMEQLEQWDAQLEPYEIAFRKAKKKVKNRRKSIKILEKLLKKNKKKAKKGPSKSKPSKKSEAIPSASKTTSTEIGDNDLTKIEGIGPKIEELLKNNQIPTFKQLAETSAKQLSELLHSAGNRFKIHQPDTWPQQAALAANGQWKDLKILQDKLKGGRKN